MCQQEDTTFIDVLHALRIGQLTSKHLEILSEVSTDAVDEFSIEKALRIYPTYDQVTKHIEKVLRYFEEKGKYSYNKGTRSTY